MACSRRSPMQRQMLKEAGGDHDIGQRFVSLVI